MVLMSGESLGKSEDLQSQNCAGDHNPDSFSSDSGVSSCGKEDSSRGSGQGSSTTAGHREKSHSQSPSQKQEGKKERRSSKEKDFKDFFHHTFPRGGGSGEFGGGERERQRDYSNFFEDDPFFADRPSSRIFEGKSRFANKPKLSERIFGRKSHHHHHNNKGRSVFDNDNFVDDLRRKIEEEKKMFFDGGSDPFSSTFGGRASSPVGGSGAGRAGFPPFDDLRSGARARFDEFANRHPMFSTMRNQPAWNLDDHFGHHHHGFDNFPRERHNSGSSGGGSGASTASTGEERVIPIQIIRDDPPKPQQQQPQQARGKSPGPPPVDVTPRVIREKSPQPPQPPPKPSGPQRCNTEPNHTIIVEDHRGARAQSAPPVSQNGTAPKVPVETADNNKPQPTQIGGNSSKTPKQEKPVPTSNNGARSIPIIIEGRKGPTVGSTPNGNCSNFSQTPPQAKVSRPAERSPTPPPKKQVLPRDPLTQVNSVYDEVKELEKQVDEYKGNSREERDYMILDEMLTRCLIKLDVVEAEGRDDVRTARKDCIKYIQSCISKLEKKTPLPPQPEENNDNMETGESKTGETEKMDTGSQQPATEGGKPPLSNNDTSKTENSDEKMDVDPSSNSNTNSCANEGKELVQSIIGGGNEAVGGGDTEKANVAAAADQQTVKA